MNMRLFVGEVQSNVFDWVELQISIVGEIVVVYIGFMRVVVVLEFIVINIYYVVDVCLVVQMVSWISGDVVVLIFVVSIVVVVIFFGVGEGIDNVQWVVILFVMVFQVEIVSFVCFILYVVLCVIVGYGRSCSKCSGIYGCSQNNGQC